MHHEMDQKPVSASEPDEFAALTYTCLRPLTWPKRNWIKYERRGGANWHFFC